MRTLLHLSDTHILPSDDDRLHGADTLHNLRAALAYFDASGIAVDAVVLSGDVANAGDTLGYQRARSVLDPWLTSHEVPLIAAMGNHDRRAAFRQVMLEQPPSDKAVDYVTWAGGLRLIALDWTVPGAPHGSVTHEQLQWLREQLASPAPEGSVLVFHHPPTIEPGPLHDIVRLHGADDLEAVVRGSDVIAILAGHVHHTLAGAFGGTLCVTAPAISYMVEPLALAAGSLQPREARGFGLVRIDDKRAVASTVYLPPITR
jgi:3',5'-cyclic AMP phosphodiesterase CpdA